MGGIFEILNWWGHFQSLFFFCFTPLDITRRRFHLFNFLEWVELHKLENGALGDEIGLLHSGILTLSYLLLYKTVEN